MAKHVDVVVGRPTLWQLAARVMAKSQNYAAEVPPGDHFWSLPGMACTVEPWTAAALSTVGSPFITGMAVLLTLSRN